MVGILVFLGLLAFSVGALALHIYGVVLCFRKSWVCGLLGLIFGIFAIVVAIVKLTCNKNLLDKEN